MKVNVGDVYPSKHYGEMKLIDKIGWKDTSCYFKVQFLNTGTITTASHRNILRGSVADVYARTIYGVACRGNISCKRGSFEEKAFRRWSTMIERCYCTTSSMYKSYGKKGVIVCDRWLIFENYVNDIQKLKGFNMDDYITGKIQLDKDHFCCGKIYSPDTCTFIPRLDNIRYQRSKIKPFIAISPDNKKYFYNTQSECARDHSLTARTIGKVLSGQFKKHKGWRFYYLV